MRPWIAAMTGAGAPLGACGLIFLLSRSAGVASFEEAARLGLWMGLFMAPLGAGLGVLAARRPAAESPLVDAVKTSSIVPALLTLPAVLLTSHEKGVVAALILAPFAFLPGPVAGGLSAWLSKRPAPDEADGAPAN